jgi:hypothetical protein
MKFTAKLLLMAFALAVVFAGCAPEEPMVVEGAGLWDLTTRTTRIYENGALVTDETRTDSLGQWQFERTGRGFFIHADAKRDTVIWEDHFKEERLIIYPKYTQFINATITKRTDNSMDLYWENEADEWQKHIKSENAVTIERAK